MLVHIFLHALEIVEMVLSNKLLTPQFIVLFLFDKYTENMKFRFS